MFRACAVLGLLALVRADNVCSAGDCFDDTLALAQLRALRISEDPTMDAIDRLLSVLPGGVPGGRFPVGLSSAKEMLAGRLREITKQDMPTELARGGKKGGERGVMLSIEWKSDDGTALDMQYDHGCTGHSPRVVCKFKWGDTITTKTDLLLKKALEKGTYLIMETGFQFRGMMAMTPIAKMMSRPITIQCPACGGSCMIGKLLKIPLPSSSSFGGPSILSSLQQPGDKGGVHAMEACPLKAGRIALNSNTTQLPTDPFLNSLDFVNHISERVYHTDGSLALMLNLTLELGPIEGVGTGGGW